MANALVHLVSIEQLAQSPHLYPEVAGALRKDIQAAKLGAIFLDLPDYQGIFRSLIRPAFKRPHRLTEWGQILHTHKPTTLGLAFAELSQTDPAFMNETWPAAFIAGYFSHIALDRVLNSIQQRLAREILSQGGHAPNESLPHLMARAEHVQTALLLRDVYGTQLYGTLSVRKLGDAFRSQNGELEQDTLDFFQKGFLKAFARMPQEKEMRSWARGFSRFVNLYSFPTGLFLRLGNAEKIQQMQHTFYRNDFFDYVAYYNHALHIAVDFANASYAYMKSGDFSLPARDEFLDSIPDLDLATPPDEDFLYTVPQSESAQEQEKKENIVPFIDPRKV